MLEVIENRYHSRFPKFSPNPLHTLDREKMIKWIEKKAEQFSNIVTHVQTQIMKMRMRNIIQ